MNKGELLKIAGLVKSSAVPGPIKGHRRALEILTAKHRSIERGFEFHGTNLDNIPSILHDGIKAFSGRGAWTSSHTPYPYHWYLGQKPHGIILSPSTASLRGKLPSAGTSDVKSFRANLYNKTIKPSSGDYVVADRMSLPERGKKDIIRKKLRVISPEQFESADKLVNIRKLTMENGRKMIETDYFKSLPGKNNKKYNISELGSAHSVGGVKYDRSGSPIYIGSLPREAAIKKTSAFEPQEHQRRPIEGHGKILYWGLGSGKSLGGIMAGQQAGGANVIVPASLRENFKKEVKKFKPGVPFDIQSYESFSKNIPKNLKDRALVIDESHRLGNAGIRSKAIESAARHAKKVVLLTGSPIRNSPNEISRLVNMAAGSKKLPESEKEFNQKYIEKQVYNPGFLARHVLRKKPYSREVAKNLGDFRGKVKGLVSYYKPPQESKDYPSVSHHKVEVEMSKSQAHFSNLLSKNLGPVLRWKVENAIPPEKKESAKLNAFLSAARQISNTTEEFDKGFKPDHASKINLVAKNIKESGGPSIAYSNYLGSGIHPLSKRLTEMGVPHLAFTGEMNDKEKKFAVGAYNSGKVKAILLSSAGGEGLDLRGTRGIHILEPHWHQEKINQVVGRGARFKSHTHLPESEQNVKVFHYISKLPQKRTLFGKVDGGRSADQYLSEMGKKKQELNNQFLNALKDSSS